MTTDAKLILFSLSSLLITLTLSLLMINASSLSETSNPLSKRTVEAESTRKIKSVANHFTDKHIGAQKNPITTLIQHHPFAASFTRFILVYGAFFISLPLIWSTLFNLAIPKNLGIKPQDSRTRYTIESLLFLLIQCCFASLFFWFITPDIILYTSYLLPTLIIVPFFVVLWDWQLSKSVIHRSDARPAVLKLKALSSYLSHGFLCFSLILFINVCLFKIFPYQALNTMDISSLYRVNLSTYPAFLSLIFIVMTMTRFPIITFKDSSFHINKHAIYPFLIGSILCIGYLVSSPEVFE